MTQSRYTAEATRLVSAARAVADESRLRILLRLVERPASVTELSTALDLPQPRVSGHLRVLAEAGLVDADRLGRLRYYRLNPARAEVLLTGLHYAAGDGPLPAADRAADDQESCRVSDGAAPNAELREARRCYDHLAGRAGVDLLDLLLQRHWLVPDDDLSSQPRYKITSAGARSFRRLGISTVTPGARRLAAFGCSDWTEGRPHLGGGLASQLVTALGRDEIITISPGSRIIAVHASIEHWLTAS